MDFASMKLLNELKREIEWLRCELRMLLSATPKAAFSLTVETTPTLISRAPDRGYKRVRVYNNDPAVTVYLGNSNVTPEGGYPLPPAAEVEFILTPEESLYAVSASATVEVRVIELS